MYGIRLFLSTCLGCIRCDFTENVTEKLAHAQAVDTRPFLPRREGPGDEAIPSSAISVANEYQC